MSKYDYAGLTAIVTGGTRGIGHATALQLAASGANVVITGRKPETVVPAAEELQAAARKQNPDAGRVIGIAAHVADPEAAKKACSQAVEEFGRLDVLINNAGTNPAFGPVHKQSAEIMAKVFQINTIGPVIWTSAAIEAGLGKAAGTDTADRSPAGAVVNVSSIGALSMEDYIGVYNASKAALLHLTKQMARELAPRIRVNSISPGVVRTKLSEALWKENEDSTSTLIPAGRIGEPEDIADAIAFLAAPTSSWLTGENLVVDGGMLVGNKTIDVTTPGNSSAKDKPAGGQSGVER
ncbi:SDR family oxidoreductase [Corynebacterium sp. ACRQJ]|uniref:SDR family oxidoreductase n=1 Tax=Corynebacterium sp. ACRQJ TaxID=2918189 RepID=UPI001EF69F89|nr:SDR family oxidoreductase [Corynebacterium sp. ACRQJ]MCG7266785.1 SDR family oxidoreductase [Corynebacterium sp. ACRQJ]